MKVIYIIGAQCTGKTTLCEALAKHLKTDNIGLKCHLLSETARKVLNLHGYTRDDVRGGGDRCLKLQELILNGQSDAEQDALRQGADIILSDRSGIDPLVYANMFCGIQSTTQLVCSSLWTGLKANMRNGLVFVCEPVEDWLFDDGVRLMPNDWLEWVSVHGLFLKLLEENDIEHLILPGSVRPIQDRIGFVYAQLEKHIGVEISSDKESTGSGF